MNTFLVGGRSHALHGQLASPSSRPQRGILVIQNAHKKAGGSTKNHDPNNEKIWGPRRLHGNIVKKTILLYKQQGVKVEAGENVRMAANKDLYAQIDGMVIWGKCDRWRKGTGARPKRMIHVLPFDHPEVKRILARHPKQQWPDPDDYEIKDLTPSEGQNIRTRPWACARIESAVELANQLMDAVNQTTNYYERKKIVKLAFTAVYLAQKNVEKMEDRITNPATLAPPSANEIKWRKKWYDEVAVPFEDARQRVFRFLPEYITENWYGQFRLAHEHIRWNSDDLRHLTTPA